ncbi:Glycosyltransferase involved in cell wall bisynthesis [Methylomagnum ishizawai]|uniref:Glycosyltransferase involved in cell wall bisynthesis n=1 Tax=Methylomagnum ishizawai TaxID=1760988 RepID=A0A1Y6D511_9GAMM|nr:glycosyltransferase family A protein [Methylomagnum ishizawai]SMF97671.1 Glycosyltransferase involved in cell wall bisynthesis [Methylomagnum ishizawai]
MNNAPLVSVVIPTYNREKWISNALDSVLLQSYVGYEIIVVDDGSTDATRRIVAQYGAQVRYLYQDNAGVSAARNKGILEARGEWVAFLDSDDEWLPEKLERQLNLIDRHPELTMVASNVEIDDGIHKLRYFDIRGKSFNSGPEHIIHQPLSAFCEINFFPSSLLVKRAALLQAGLFDENLRLYEDRDLGCRLALCGTLGILAEPLARIISRGGGDISLSASQECDRRRGYRAGIATYEKLLGESGLDLSARAFIRRRLAGERFYYGVDVFKRGDKRLGLGLMWRSCRDYPSATALARCLLFFILGQGGLAFIQTLKYGRGYMRSEPGKPLETPAPEGHGDPTRHRA